jgi:hypothetical protein
MASFADGGVMTNLGVDLRAKTDAGAELELLRLVMGDGEAAGGTDLKTLTSLVNEVAEFDINSVTFIGDGKARIRSILSNAGLETGFYAKEVGIIALDPDIGEILYVYAAADPGDWIPPQTESFQQIFDIIAVTGATEDITVTLAPNVATVTLQEMQDHEALELDPTDTDAEKEKHLSNAQAKVWQDHAAQTYRHGRENRIINGNFDIWQRGTSGGLSSRFMADRWLHVGTGYADSLAWSQVSGAPGDGGPAGSRYRLRVNVTEMDPGFWIGQRMEGCMWTHGAPVSISVWVKSTVSMPQFKVKLARYPDWASRVVDGAVESVFSVPSGVWTQLTAQLLFPDATAYDSDDATTSFFLVPQYTGDAQIDIAQGQVQVSEVPTVFEHRSKAEEIMLCQRFFRKSYSLQTPPGHVTYVGILAAEETDVGNTIHNMEDYWSPPMRATPIMTAYSPNTGSQDKIYDTRAGADVPFGGFSGLCERGFFGVSHAGTMLSDPGRPYLHYTADAEFV